MDRIDTILDTTNINRLKENNGTINVVLDDRDMARLSKVLDSINLKRERYLAILPDLLGKRVSDW